MDTDNSVVTAWGGTLAGWRRAKGGKMEASVMSTIKKNVLGKKTPKS